MKREDETKEQLIDELVELRRRVAESEASEAEWKRMRKALRESEGKYRWIFENAREGISIYEELPDGSRKLVDYNPQYVEMSGYSREEFMRITDTVKIQQDHRTPEEKAADIEKAKAGQPFSGTFSWRRPDGKENYIEYTAAPLYIDGRRFTIGIDHDITEHKRVEETLVEERNLLRTMIDNVPDQIYVKDTQGRFTLVNVSLARLVGAKAPEDIVGKTDFDFFPQEASAHYYAYEQEIIESGQSVINKEEFGTHPTGGQGWVLTTKVPLRDSAGKIIGLVGINRDITERKQAEEELIRLYNAVNMTTDSVVIGDLEAKIIDVNEATLRMYDTDDKGDLIGRNSLDLIAPEDREKALRSMEEALEKGYAKEEYHIIAKDGSRIPVEMNSALMKDADGKPIGFVAVSRDIAERKRAEAALAAEKEHLAVTLRSIGDGVISCDMKGKVVLVNQVAEKHTGWTEEEAIGKPLEEVFHIIDEDTRERCQDPVRRVLETGRIVDLANRTVLIARDGTERIIADSAAPIRDRDGNIIGVVLVFRDVTERRKAEEELRASKEMLSNVLSASPGGISLIENEVIKWGNDAMARLFGFEREEDYIGQSIRMLYASEEEYERVNQILHDNSGRGDTTQVDAEFRRKDGSVFDGSLRVRPEASPNHENRVIVTISDVSWRKQAENALRESEEKYRLVVENASEGIAVLQDDVIKFVNPGVVEISGYSKDEVSSRSFLEFIHPEDRQAVLERFQKRLRGEEVPYYPVRFADKNGNIKWVEINAVLINWEGRPATLNFFRDTTDKRKMEEELLKVQKLESIGVLAGGIAHDFNNILTAVSGNISLVEMYLETGRSRSETLERLEEAGRASTLAKDLTHQLLTFSKGGTPIKELASIGEVLKDTVAFALRGSNVNFRLSISDDLWPVEVDKGQISQVIANLVINADQAMPGGGVIQVSAENVTIVPEHGLPLEAGEYIEVSIQDQGIGIPREHLQRIFDPFFTTKQKGSGLGLATSYSIVKKHDGYIAVESRVGAGSTFHIYLPASSEKAPMKEEKKEEENSILGEGNVLVMDDEEYIRDLAGEMLSSIGYKVTTSTDGTEAVELYKEAMESGQIYSAVIVDLTVPGGMGGKETIQKLKQIDPEVRAIVSSGYSNDPIMADFKRYGFRGVIAKPYEVHELSDILREVVMGATD